MVLQTILYFVGSIGFFVGLLLCIPSEKDVFPMILMVFFGIIFLISFFGFGKNKKAVRMGSGEVQGFIEED